MGIRFVWDQGYTVGNPAIDEQHKNMFVLANSLPEKMEAAEVKRVIMDLYKHSRQHFRDAVQMMKEIDYPKLKEHCELHEKLITQLNEISSRSFESDEEVVKFKRFVYDWVLDHILNHDKDYFHFTQQTKEQSNP